MVLMTKFETVKNMRDLGGIKTTDGKKVKKGLLLRSGHLHALSDQEFLILKNDFNLKHVVDFRSTDSKNFRKPNIDNTINYYHFYTLEFLENNSFFGDHEDKIDIFFEHVYRSLANAKEAALAYRNFLRVLIDGEQGATLFHCTAGKDRTGVAASILLKLLGSNKEAIYNEYYLTNIITNPILEEKIRQTDPNDYKQISYYKAYYTAKEEYLDLFFKTIDEKYGSFDNYAAKGLKLNEKDIKTLKDKYLV